MSSATKTILILALLGAVVFGATVISQLAPTPDPQTLPDAVNSSATPTLVVGFSEYQYKPDAEDELYHHRNFHGFFEIGTGGGDTGPRNWVGFTMINSRNTPSSLRPLTLDCKSCTSARIAPLTNAAIQEYAGLAAAGNFFSLPGVMNPLAAIAWANTVRKAEWFTFDFEKPDHAFAVPPGSVVAPSWMLLELDFRVTKISPPILYSASFDLLDAKQEKLAPNPFKFKVTYAGREPFEIWPRSFDVGDMPEGIEPQSLEVFVYSMTRGFDRLTPPAVAVDSKDGTIQIAEPKPLTGPECLQLERRLSVESRGGIRVLSAYRYKITLRREVAGKKPEAGEFIKNIDFANQSISNQTYRVEVHGQITGAVRLDDGRKIDIGVINTSIDVAKAFRILSDQADLEIELVPERCEPGFVNYTLASPQMEFGKKVWILNVSAEKNRV